MEKIEGYSPNVEEPDLTGTYTARDYLSWKWEEYAELIRGKIFKMTAPTRRHQYLNGQLNYFFIHHFRRHKCEVYAAPFDVYLIHPGEDWKSTRNILQPDLCVICDKPKLQERGCMGAPDLAVEILSPSTAKKDLGDKRDLYEEYGVKELWIVHPADQTVVQHVLENNKFKILPIHSSHQRIQSVIFPDLEIDLSEVFLNENE